MRKIRETAYVVCGWGERPSISAWENNYVVATYGLPDLFVPRLHLVPEYTFPQNATFTVFSLRPFTCGTTPPLLHRYCTATHLRAQVEEQPGALVVQREVPHGVFVPNLLAGKNALGKEGRVGGDTFTRQKTSV